MLDFFVLHISWLGCYFQVVNRLRKEYVYDTLVNYGVNYDNIWIYDKIHHEINQFCSSHSLQQVYIDVFDQVRKNYIKCVFSKPCDDCFYLHKQLAELIIAICQAWTLAIKVCPLQVFWKLTTSFVESFTSTMFSFLFSCEFFQWIHSRLYKLMFPWNFS